LWWRRLGFTLPTEATARRGREQRAGAGDLFGAEQVTLVGAVLDLAADALPVLLEGVVAGDQRLQLEALTRVADLLAPQHVDAAIDVLPRDLRLELFDAEKVLLVQRSQPLQAGLELLQGDVDLFVLHVQPSRGKMSRLSKHTEVSQSLKPKCSWPGPTSGSGSERVKISTSSTLKRTVRPSRRSIAK
jgi:hypothetical protein